MKIIRKLLHGASAPTSRIQRLRGLSTAELVGIIVVVGILGALGGTYIAGLVTQAKTNALSQNVQSLNTVAASALAGGATLNVGAGAGPAAGVIDVTSADTALTCLNTGVSVTTTTNGVSNTVTYQMSPPISSAAMATEETGGTPSYIFVGTPTGSSTSLQFTVGSGASIP